MPKTKQAIHFEKIGPNLYRTASRSEPGAFYNVGVVYEGGAQCCCYAANRKGINGCAHAQALVEQGHAVVEEIKHDARLLDNVPGVNFRIECSCGYTSNIASRRDYAEKALDAHVNPPPRPDLFGGL